MAAPAILEASSSFLSNYYDFLDALYRLNTLYSCSGGDYVVFGCPTGICSFGTSSGFSCNNLSVSCLSPSTVSPCILAALSMIFLILLSLFSSSVILYYMLFLILLIQVVFSQTSTVLKVPFCSKIKHQHRRLFYYSENGQTDIGRINYFTFDQNGSSTGATPTVVNICHDLKYLYVNFTNTDSDIISSLKGCNSPLYTEDAV